jgi:NitT/TauT family transport system permease protein
VKRFPDWAWPVLAFTMLIVLWDVSIRVFDLKPFILPSPASVAEAMVADWPELADATLYTLVEIVLGFALSVIVGIGLAVAIVTWRPLEKAIYPILVGAQVIPKVAIAPLFVVWLGLGLAPKVLIAFLLSFFPMVVNTVVGLRAIEIGKLHLARSMGASAAQIFFRFRLPRAMPNIFAGLKLSVTAAVIGAIVGEFIGADEGMGRVLLVANGNLETAKLFAGIVLLSAVGIALFLIIAMLEKVVIRWHVSQRVLQELGS